MAAIGTLTIEMAANVARLQRDMDSARKSVDGAMAKITKAANLAKGALGALGVGLSAVGISNFVKGVANAADEVGKLAQRTGVAAGDLQRLKFAAEMSGIGVGSLTTALQVMSRNLNNASEDSGEAAKGFQALGISVKNADGELKSSTQIMAEVAGRFARMQDGAQKTALAMQLFGKSGAELIPMLNEGQAGLEKMYKEAERLGIVMSDDLIKASTAFNDNLSILQNEIKGLMVTAIAPFIQRLAEITTRFVEARQAGLGFFQSIARGFTQTTIIEDLTNEISKLEREISKLENARRGPGAQRRGQIQEMNDRLLVLRKNLADALAKLNEVPPTLEKFTVVAGKSAEELRRLAEIQRYYNQQIDEYFASEERQRIAIENSIRVGREMIEDLQFEAKALAMTNQEREVAIRLRRLEAAGIKEGSAAYEELAIRIREAVAGKEAIAEAIERQKTLAEEWRKTTEEINRTLTDALMRAFESGKGFGKSFKDTMVNLFRTMILRPILAPVVAGLTGGLSPAMGADGTTSTLSIVSGIKTTYDMLTKGFANIGATVSESLLRAGDYLATSSSDFLANSGTFLQNISQTAGTIASSVAAAAAGIALNTIISGGYSMGKGMDTFQKVGVAVASFINPVLGIVIGALTGVVNRLFGRKLADVGLEGTFGPEGFTGSRYEFLKGGVFRSNKTNRFPLEEELTMGFSAQFQSLRTATFLMAATLGEVSEDILGFTKNIKISFMGLTKDQIQERIAEEFENIADEMAVLVPNLLNFQRVGENASETLQRLFNSATAANQAFDTLNIRFRATSLATADMASQLVDLFGGIERFGQVTDQFFVDFYTEAERSSIITRQLTEALALLGLELPQTRDAYRQLAEAQDLTTDAGRRTYASLLQLSPVFASLTLSMDELNKAASDANAALNARILQERGSLELRLLNLLGNTVELRRREIEALDGSNRALLQGIFFIEDQQAAIAAQNQAIQDARQREQEQLNLLQAAFSDYQAATDAALASVERAISKQRESLELSRRLAEEQAQTIRSVFNVLNDAILGLTGGGFTASAGRAFIQQALATAQATGYLPESGDLQRAISAATRGGDFASSFEQRRDQALLVTRLTQLRGFANNQLSATEQQISKLDQQIEALNDQLNVARQQVDQLRNVDNSVKAIPVALEMLRGAISNELRTLTAVTAQIRVLQAQPTTQPTIPTGGISQATVGAFNAAVAAGNYASAAAIAVSAGASASVVTDYINANLGGLNLPSAVETSNIATLMNQVDSIYQQVFGRPAEAGGLSYYTEALAKGALTESQLMAAIVAGAQNEDILAARARGFASGGMHEGGMRIVGERGPELEMTGPARYMSNANLASMMNGNEEIRALRDENKAQMRSLVSLQSRMTRLLERWDGDGLPEERAVA